MADLSTLEVSIRYGTHPGRLSCTARSLELGPYPVCSLRLGTCGCAPVPQTGTKVHSDVPRYQKPERGYIRQNHPFTKPPFCFISTFIRKLEKAVAVRNSLLEDFSGKFRRCWKIIRRFSGSTKCYPCQGLGIFRQGKWLLEIWPRLWERCWIFSSETATAFLSSSVFRGVRTKMEAFPRSQNHNIFRTLSC